MTVAFRKLIAATVAGAALVAASAASAEDVKLGFLGGFTGPIETLVPPIHDAAALAVKHVNDQGGILGGQLSMVQADSTCIDATAASNAADRLVNAENVPALVGPLCSGETIAAANSANDNLAKAAKQVAEIAEANMTGKVVWKQDVIVYHSPAKTSLSGKTRGDMGTDRAPSDDHGLACIRDGAARKPGRKVSVKGCVDFDRQHGHRYQRSFIHRSGSQSGNEAGGSALILAFDLVSNSERDRDVTNILSSDEGPKICALLCSVW